MPKQALNRQAPAWSGPAAAVQGQEHSCILGRHMAGAIQLQTCAEGRCIQNRQKCTEDALKKLQLRNSGRCDARTTSRLHVFLALIG